MFINVHIENIISIEINMLIIIFGVILISKFNAGITKYMLTIINLIIT